MRATVTITGRGVVTLPVEVDVLVRERDFKGAESDLTQALPSAGRAGAERRLLPMLTEGGHELGVDTEVVTETHRNQPATWWLPERAPGAGQCCDGITHSLPRTMAESLL